MGRTLIVVRGGGDLGSGVAHRLRRAGYDVTILEIEQPTVIRRRVAFASAVYDGEIMVEGVKALRVPDAPTARWAMSQDMIAVLVDPHGRLLPALKPAAVVDARLASGVRVHAVLGAVADRGTCLSLRVPRATTLSLEEWVAGGALAPAATRPGRSFRRR